MIRRPFFSYYGGKFKIARHYPPPLHSRLIEPFAGAAGYACRYHWLSVHLYDVDPVICGVWDYLIHASREDILALPLLHLDASLSDLPASVCQEARWLIGFWLGKGQWKPREKCSQWCADERYRDGWFWSERIRYQLAEQVQHIRHWKVRLQSYYEIPGFSATWFIDPPYSSPGGSKYTHSRVDFKDLAEWCLRRRGQVIVCEQMGSSWLPFEFLTSAVSCGRRGTQISGRSEEALFYRAS